MYVRLGFADKALDPEEITRELGVHPTELWHVGDWRHNRRSKYTSNAWFFKSNAVSDDVMDHVNDIMNSGLNHEALPTIAKRHLGYLSVILRSEGSGIYIEPELISLLANSNLGLEVIIRIHEKHED